MKRRVLAIILAAGKSVRFGKQKLLQPFFGSPLILRTIRPFLDFQLIDEVIVVVGFRKDEMIEVLKPYAVRIVVNEDYERGLSSSILAALPFVGDDDEV
ncbi:MAG: NTP transferase domain-containing protein, partial [Candidatus Bathyarchaeia archaeon]